MKIKQYFSYEWQDGIEFHDTEEEARDHINKCLEEDRGNSCAGGWPEEMENSCFGRIIESVQMKSRKKASEDSEFDEILDFELLGYCSDNQE